MKKFSLVFVIFLISITSSSNAQSVCGDWLCGSTMSRVHIENSYSEGINGSTTGGSIGIGTNYSSYMCCASSSEDNACHIGSQDNEGICQKGRANGAFRHVRRQ